MGLKETWTTPLRPRSDSMVEKFKWTLAKFCGKGQSERDRKGSVLLMAYQSAEHEATEYCQFP